MRQNSTTEMAPIQMQSQMAPDGYSHQPPALQSYMDPYAYGSYAPGYAYDSSYISQHAMYTEEPIPAQVPQHPPQLTQQHSIDHHHHHQFYAPLDQYSRVQSVGNIKMATRELEMSRHGVSMSQPDLSTATWGDDSTKYQML